MRIVLWSLAAWRVAAQEWNTSHYTVCTTLFPPMAICAPGGDPDMFTGHDIEQMRIVARRLGWAPEDYTFKCFAAFSDVLDDLAKESGSQCSVAASGVTRSTVRQEAGIQFTYPTYRSVSYDSQFVRSETELRCLKLPGKDKEGPFF